MNGPDVAQAWAEFGWGVLHPAAVLCFDLPLVVLAGMLIGAWLRGRK
jgi:hypothetical protein